MILNLKGDVWKEAGATDNGQIVDITVAKQGKNVLVNGEVTKVTYNGIQLRFTLEAKGWCYIVFDDRHKPPKPIRELYKDLK